MLGSFRQITSSGGGGGAVSSVFSRTGAVVATASDYTGIYQPSINTPTAITGVVATTSIPSSSRVATLTSASNVTLTSNPQVATGVNGQEIELVNIGSFNIGLSDGNGLILGRAVTLFPSRGIRLRYLSNYSSWVDTCLTQFGITATPGTADTQLATTAFVEGAISPTWSAFTFQNSFSDFGGGYQTCRFTRVRGVVYLQGLATRATAGFTSGMIIATLPVGFRPSSTLRVALDAAGNTPANVIDIEATGNVKYLVAGTVTSILPSFSGINFVP